MAAVASEETRFGAAWAPVEQAVAVLRARAARHGLRPSATWDGIDAAAAVVAADAWMLALGADTLDVPARHGEAAVRALGAVLARAAGAPVEGGEPVGGSGSFRPAWLVEIERYEGWASAVTTDGAAVLRRAAGDLAIGAGDSRLSWMAEALATAAALVDDV